MNTIKTYNQALQYIFSKLPVFQRQGPKALKYDLSNILKFAEAIGNPHNNFKSIHIAGTNAKGTVSHAIASVFQEAGYKTGLYTSPHYKDYRERIKINGKYIQKDFVKNFIIDNYDVIEKLKPSYFELSVAMAFKYFEREKVDIAIIETGLGGRLDSTNIIVPLLSVITNISMDHTQTLGDNLASIAREKAGIIKAKVPVVIGERQEETVEVFKTKAAEMQAPLVFARDIVRVDVIKEGDYCTKMNIASFNTSLEQVKTSLTGPFSAVNIRYSLAALLTFREYNKDFIIDDVHISNGLRRIKRNTKYKGRWQIIKTGKSKDGVTVIADGAHNLAAIKNTIYYIENGEYNNLHIIMGVVDDKDWDEVMKVLPAGARYYFTKANIPRAMNEKKLKKKAALYNLSGDSFPHIEDAKANALSNAEAGDIILILGSIYLVGEIIPK